MEGIKVVDFGLLSLFGGFVGFVYFVVFIRFALLFFYSDLSGIFWIRTRI